MREKILTKKNEDCKELGSWHDGGCCCNCKYQVDLHSHPWNKDFGKGKIGEICGYACIVVPDNSWLNQATFSDRKHGYCEFHTVGLMIDNSKNKLVL